MARAEIEEMMQVEVLRHLHEDIVEHLANILTVMAPMVLR